MNLIEALQKQMELCERERIYKCGVYVTSQFKKDVVMKVISNLFPVLNREVEIRNNRCEAFVKFPNGNFIRIVLANNNARGQRFNGIIIDSMVNKNTVDTVITPCLKPLLDENNRYDINDVPLKRMYFCNINSDDIVESAHRAILYVASARGNEKSQKQLKYIMDSMANDLNIRSVNYDENIFEKEYECMFYEYENEYDHPIVDKDLNGQRVLLYEAWGIPAEKITYSKEFINKTRRTYLDICGQYSIEDIGFENDLNVHLLIDTNTYDGFEVSVKDGMVKVVLHEIENEEPVLRDLSN